jgi:hypothetical protein
LVRTLYDCPDVAMGTSGLRCRVVIATHPSGPTKHRIGVERDGVVYELFLADLPQSACTAADVGALYLHRGAFENALADEDLELDPDRWCSHAACGQELWQIISQWVWNLRLELGHQLAPEPVRTTEFASALPPTQTEATPSRGFRAAEVALPRTRWSLLGARLHSSARWHVTLSRLRSHWSYMSGVKKPMGACGWCTRPAFVVAAPGRMPRAVSMEWERHR